MIKEMSSKILTMYQKESRSDTLGHFSKINLADFAGYLLISDPYGKNA